MREREGGKRGGRERSEEENGEGRRSGETPPGPGCQSEPARAPERLTVETPLEP